jgi:hypothetical protein
MSLFDMKVSQFRNLQALYCTYVIFKDPKDKSILNDFLLSIGIKFISEYKIKEFIDLVKDMIGLTIQGHENCENMTIDDVMKNKKRIEEELKKEHKKYSLETEHNKVNCKSQQDEGFDFTDLLKNDMKRYEKHTKI